MKAKNCIEVILKIDIYDLNKPSYMFMAKWRLRLAI